MSGVNVGDKFIVIDEFGHHFQRGSEIIFERIFEGDMEGSYFLGKMRGHNLVVRQFLYWNQVQPLNIIEENE
jgi:hypothetical protein